MEEGLDIPPIQIVTLRKCYAHGIPSAVMAKNNTYWVGTDVGGTFTDMVVIDSEGVVTVTKNPTTPDDRSRGVLDAFGHAGEILGLHRRRDPEQHRLLRPRDHRGDQRAHRAQGRPTGLITTRGFGDTILHAAPIGRWAGLGPPTGHYSTASQPGPDRPARRILEIAERVDSRRRGSSSRSTRSRCARRSRELRARGVEAIAICFLWSFSTAAHEQRAARDRREEAPGMSRHALERDRCRCIGEYERTVDDGHQRLPRPGHRALRRRRSSEAPRGAASAASCSSWSPAAACCTAAEAAERSVGAAARPARPAASLALAALGERSATPT